MATAIRRRMSGPTLDALLLLLVAVTLTASIRLEYCRGSPVWLKATLARESRPAGAAACPDGSFVVVGTYSGRAVFGAGEPGETVLNANEVGNGFVARFVADGTLEWVRAVGDLGGSYPAAVAALDDGSAVVLGDSLARYAADGTLVWTRSVDKVGREELSSVSAAPDGSFWVAGRVGNAIEMPAEPGTCSLTFGPGEPNETTLVNAGSEDAVFARYSSDGRLQWAKRVGGPGSEHAHSVSALDDGSALVAGCYQGAVVFGEGEPGETTLEEAGWRGSAFLARYRGDGTLQWVTTSGGCGRAMAASADGSAVVAGNYRDRVTFGAGEEREVSCDSDSTRDPRLFVASFDPAGDVRWVWCQKRGGVALPLAVARSADGDAVTTGVYFGKGAGVGDEVDADWLRLPCTSCIFAMRYGSDGQAQWLRHPRSPYQVAGWTSQGRSIAFLPDDTVLIVGLFHGRLVFGSDPLQETAVETNGWNAFHAKLAP